MKAFRKNFLVLGLATLVCAGCVSEQITPEYKPRMGVAESDGFVYFVLNSRKGYEYAILYHDKTKNVWKVVPGCERIRGTGEEIQLKKPFNSRGPLPDFTLRHTKLN